MKRRVVSSKDNKRSFRWLQAAGQCKAPFTVIIDLSFARAVVREANLSPSIKQSAIVHFGGNATRLMNDKLETPCRVVVTAATMAAADKYRNEVRDAQQAKRENEQREQKEIQKQQQQQNQDASKATKQQQQQQKQKAAAVITIPKDTTTPTGSYVEEDFRIANDVRAFLKSCELWSPPPAVMESRGPGNEQKSVAEAVLFGRPSMELRADAARPPRHGVIVATHNPDTKIEIANALNKFSAHNEVAVCVLRCLSKPFALRLDPLNENMKNTTMGASGSNVNVGAAAANPVNNMISSAKSPLQQQKQPPLSQRAAADLHFVKKLQEQNLISNKKANFVVKSIGGDSILSSKKLKQQQEQEEETKRRASTLKQDEAVANADEENAVDGTTSNESKFQIEKKKVHAIHDKERAKKAKKENHHRHDNNNNSSSSNPLATKKKLVRVPLKISKQ